MLGKDLEQALAHEFVARAVVVGAGGFVGELVHEVHDATAVVADRPQNDERIQLRLRRRAEAGLGFDKGGLGASPFGDFLERSQPEGDVPGEFFEKLDLARVEPARYVCIDG